MFLSDFPRLADYTSNCLKVSGIDLSKKVPPDGKSGVSKKPMDSSESVKHVFSARMSWWRVLIVLIFMSAVTYNLAYPGPIKAYTYTASILSEKYYIIRYAIVTLLTFAVLINIGNLARSILGLPSIVISNGYIIIFTPFRNTIKLSDIETVRKSNLGVLILHRSVKFFTPRVPLLFYANGNDIVERIQGAVNRNATRSD